MSTFLDLIGALLLLAGTAFLLLGGLGLVRMPDVFNRIQAGTKTTTLGTLLTLAGVALIQPGWAPPLLLIGLFLLFTNPLSSQVLARAAHRSGGSESPTLRVDRLAEDRPQGGAGTSAERASDPLTQSGPVADGSVASGSVAAGQGQQTHGSAEGSAKPQGEQP